jgi:hypothetical protein
MTKEERDKELYKRQINDLHNVMCTAEGRRLLWLFFAYSEPLKDVTRLGFNSSIYYNAGKQGFGQWLVSEIMKHPELYALYTKMRIEAENDPLKEVEGNE